jgi:hypothetical protein
MKRRHLFLVMIYVTIFSSCRSIIKENYDDPEIQSLRDGIKSSVSLGYCASIAYSFFKGEDLPDNVVVVSQANNEGSQTVILQVLIDDAYPLPLNSSVGQISIAGTWEEKATIEESGGVITAIFTDVNILESKYEFIGFQTVPIQELEDGSIKAMFGKQDFVVGDAPDNLINLWVGTNIFSYELSRFDESDPGDDVFALIGQDAWFMKINRNNTPSDIYDDEYTIDGGGQIFGSLGGNDGALFHAILDAKYRYSTCQLNPASGVGFVQNFKTDQKGNTDLGHAFLDFHSSCDGKAHVKVATGKYLLSIGKSIDLNLF